MSTQGIARRYASALADVVTAQNEAPAVSEELAQWVQLMKENTSLGDVFRTPVIPFEQKQQLLETLIKRAQLRQTTANFLRVLVRNHRLAEIEEIQKSFVNELNVRAGMVAAHVTTAHPVAADVQQSLREQLTSLTGRKVQLDFSVDADLIGGVVTKIGSTIYDGSVRNQLDEMRDKLVGAR